MRKELLHKITTLRQTIRKANLYTPVEGISNEFDRKNNISLTLKKSKKKANELAN